MPDTLPNVRMIALTVVILLAGCATPPPPAPKPDIPARFDQTHYRNAPGAEDYPIASRKLWEQGDVLLALLILADGSLGEIRLERSSGFERLDDAAVEFYRNNAKFLPAEKDGKKVAAWKTIRVVWKLKEPQYDAEGRLIN